MQERNHCLDFFKGLAALCVIFVHIEFPGSFGKIAKGAGGCAVLLFFIISGYSAYGSRAEMCPKLLRRFRRNLLLTLTAAGVYFAVTAYERITFCHDFKYWLRNLSQPKLYLRLFLLGDLDFIHGAPLWFMVALLYAYLVFWVIARFDLKKAACIAMPFFVLLRICMVTYKNTHHTDWHTCSNLLVSALPMMLTGYWIAHHREKLKKTPGCRADRVLFAGSGLSCRDGTGQSARRGYRAAVPDMDGGICIRAVAPEAASENLQTRRADRRSTFAACVSLAFSADFAAL